GSEGCWVDFGATTHVCYDRKLKFTSIKIVILKDVMHTPEMRKNLVLCYLLNKARFIQTLAADLFTLTKNGMFVGKGLGHVNKRLIKNMRNLGGSEGWWVDFGATIHVCYDRSMFNTYIAASASDDKKMLLGDHHTANVAGIGNVELKFTSAKTVILKDVMHTPEMRKNLVSCYLLNKAGFIQTLGANLFTLTKNVMFVGKGYATDGMLI
nr:zinc finger, CCHC-type [Tanacetum cinerariifolium]